MTSLDNLIGRVRNGIRNDVFNQLWWQSCEQIHAVRESAESDCVEMRTENILDLNLDCLLCIFQLLNLHDAFQFGLTCIHLCDIFKDHLKREFTLKRKTLFLWRKYHNALINLSEKFRSYSNLYQELGNLKQKKRFFQKLGFLEKFGFKVYKFESVYEDSVYILTKWKLFVRLQLRHEFHPDFFETRGIIFLKLCNFKEGQIVYKMQEKSGLSIENYINFDPLLKGCLPTFNHVIKEGSYKTICSKFKIHEDLSVMNFDQEGNHLFQTKGEFMKIDKNFNLIFKRTVDLSMYSTRFKQFIFICQMRCPDDDFDLYDMDNDLFGPTDVNRTPSCCLVDKFGILHIFFRKMQKKCNKSLVTHQTLTWNKSLKKWETCHFPNLSFKPIAFCKDTNEFIYF